MTTLETPLRTPKVGESLSFDESLRLKQLETTIERGLKASAEMGEALEEIRDDGLYRNYHDFESYIEERWGMAPRHAYRLIDFARVIRNLTGRSETFPILPTSEWQARPLSAVRDPDQVRKVWQRAIETAPNSKVTARHVAETVRAFLGEPIAAVHPPVWTLHQAVDHLGRKVYEISQRWPQDQLAVLAGQLRALADELMTNGELCP